MTRRMPLWAHGRNHDGLGPQLDRQPRGRLGAGEIFQRHIGHRQQAPVDAAEVRHHPVMRIGRRIAEFHVAGLVEPEIAEAEGGENELAGKTETVHRSRPVLAPERSEGGIVLVEQDRIRRRGAVSGVLMPRALRIHPVRMRMLPLVHRQVVIPRQQALLEIRVEHIGHLHEMTVRVMDEPSGGVGHGGSSRAFLRRMSQTGRMSTAKRLRAKDGAPSRYAGSARPRDRRARR